MKELFESMGMSCKSTFNGVECKFEKLKPEKTAGILAAATSMDLRMQDPCGSPGYSRFTLCNFAREKAKDLETWFWKEQLRPLLWKDFLREKRKDFEAWFK